MREERIRGQSHRVERSVAVILAIVLTFGLMKAGLLPHIPTGEGQWVYWASYGIGGAIFGLGVYEGWRLIK